jgi:hypothetical protein
MESMCKCSKDFRNGGTVKDTWQYNAIEVEIVNQFNYLRMFNYNEIFYLHRNIVRHRVTKP